MAKCWPRSKFMPPTIEGLVPREGLDRWLAAVPPGGIAWATGPAGSGKTALGSQLAHATKSAWIQAGPEDANLRTLLTYVLEGARHCGADLSGVPPITDLTTMLNPSALIPVLATVGEQLPSLEWVIIDDYHRIADDLPVHHLLAASLGALRGGLRILVLSRRRPPPAFARLAMEGRLTVLDGERMALRRHETAAIYRKRSGGHVPNDAELDRLQEQTHGWVAALIIGLDSANRNFADLRPTGERWFDYLAEEILCDLEPEVQRVALHTAWLPVLRASRIETLLGVQDAVGILHLLAERIGLIRPLSSEEAFVVHPLLREFFQAALKRELGPEAVRELLVKSSDILAEDGEIDEALSLLYEAGEWESLQRQAIAWAPRFLFDGRRLALMRWLDCVPASVHAASPIARFWKARATLPFAPATVVPELEALFSEFTEAGQVENRTRAWAGLLEAEMFQLRRFDRLSARLALLSTSEVDAVPAWLRQEIAPTVFMATFFAGNSSSSCHDWHQEAERAARTTRDDDLRAILTAALVYAHGWVGGGGFAMEGRELLRFHVDRCRVPFLRMAGLATMYRALWLDYRIDEASDVLDRIDEIVAGSGLESWACHVVLCRAMVAVARGEMVTAQAHWTAAATELSKRGAEERATLFRAKAWFEIAAGNPAAAVVASRAASEGSKLSGFAHGQALNWLSQAIAEAMAGGESADECIERARAAGIQTQSKRIIAETGILRAMRAPAPSKREIHQASWSRLRESNMLPGPWWPREMLAVACNEALDLDIETDWVSTVIERCALVPPRPLLASEAWPWRIRVRTLGHQEVEIAGAPLTPAKARRLSRPRTLLHCLIALGGRAASTALEDRLWPDADGSAAAAALKTNIARLRKLLGFDAVIVSDGTVCLAPSVVWVDALAVQEHIRMADPVTAARACQRLMRGPLLPFVEEQWVLQPRNALLRSVVATLLSAFDTLASSELAEAIACLEHAHELAPAREDVAKRLAEQYAGAGRSFDAQRVLKRCVAENEAAGTVFRSAGMTRGLARQWN